MALPLESVPNVSEGRDPAAIDAIGEAFAASARLLDVHSDPDHHRSVFTLVGEDDALVESLAAGVARAVELVDLVPTRARTRVGAVDVVPLVPLRPEDEPRARAALALADRLGELGLPVLFYGRLTEDGREPAFFRGGGTDELGRRLALGELVPDRGPAGCTRPQARCSSASPAADRVQRQPALRRRRGRRGRSRGSCASATAASRACGRSASRCRRPGSSR